MTTIDDPSDLDSPPLTDSADINEPTLLQAVINAVPAPIFFKDKDGLYLGGNRAFEEFVGHKIEDMVGKSVFELWEPELAQVYFDADSRLYKTGGKQVYEAQVTYADGSLHDVIFHKAVFQVEGTGESGIVGAILDITERKKAETDLIQMTKTDSLTGLSNRRSLYDLLDGACLRAERHKKLLAVLALDLDGFKEVNDTHGHQFGDRVLIEVARRLKAIVRKTDTVSRFGGDEFIFVLEDMDAAEQAAVVSSTIIKAIAEPFELEGKSVTISASIGIGVYGVDGSDFDSLMHSADTALYAVKKDGRGHFRFHKS